MTPTNPTIPINQHSLLNPQTSLPFSKRSFPKIIKSAIAMAVARLKNLLTSNSSVLPLCHTSSITSRSFAAAALQCYEDYGYHHEDDHHRRQSTVDDEGSEHKRGVQWVIVGEPGANKRVYAQRLSKLLDVPHISMASLLREDLHPRSSLYKQIESTVSRGMLVPEDVVFGLLSKKLEEEYVKGKTGLILEGIPRTRKQAEILDQIVEIDLVLNLKCTDGQLVERKLPSGLSFQLQGNQIKPCSDDIWTAKLRTHVAQSKPLEDYYRKQKKLVEFQVSEGLGETWKGLLTVLQLQHLDSSFHKLTA